MQTFAKKKKEKNNKMGKNQPTAKENEESQMEEMFGSRSHTHAEITHTPRCRLSSPVSI